MRVTEQILQNNFISNLNFSSERLYETETQVLTGKRLNKPSDDPVDTMTALAIRSRVDEIEQYKRNISNAKTLLQNTESVVTQVAEVLERVNVLVVQGSSDSTGSTDRLSISYEVDQILEQMVNYANTRTESIYVFAGTYSDTAPYTPIRNADGEITAVTSNGSSGDIDSAIGDGINIKVNINGEEMFEGENNIFDMLIKIRDDLRSGTSNDINTNLETLSSASDTIYNVQARLGSRLNRVLSAESRAENDVINFTEHLSSIEDADASQVIIDYQTELLTLQASLQAGSRLLQQNLAAFLG